MSTARMHFRFPVGRLARAVVVLVAFVAINLAVCVFNYLSPVASARYPVIDRWEFEQIPLPARYARLAQDTNATMSLAVDAQDRAHMILGEADAVYAYRDDNGWTFQALGRRYTPTLRLDDQGRPHLVYYDGGRLHYEVLEYGTWIERHSFATNSDAHGFALDTSGYPHVAYIRSDAIDGSTPNPAYTWWDGAAWHDELVAPGRAVGNVGLALNNAGNPTVVYGIDPYSILASVPGPDQAWQESAIIEPITGSYVFMWFPDFLQVSSDSNGNTIIGHQYAEQFIIKPTYTWTYWTSLHRLSPDGDVVGLASGGPAEHFGMQAIHAPGLSGTVFYAVDKADGLWFTDVTTVGSTQQHLPNLDAADVATGPDGQPRMIAQGPEGVLYGWRHEVELTNQVFLPLSGNNWVGNWVADDPTGVTSLVSMGRSGRPFGNGASYPRVSDDGRYVVFDNANSTWGPAGAVVRDRATSSNLCIVAGSLDDCLAFYDVVISSDGRFYAIETARKLLPEDTDDARDIYLYDFVNDTMRLVSDLPELTDTGYGATDPAFSGDGSMIAYVGRGDLGYGIVLFNRHTGQSSYLSDDAAPSVGFDSRALSLSADGSHVAFVHYYDLPVAGDSNIRRDVFVYDRQAKQIELVSISSDGAQSNGSSDDPVISGDGRFVVFTSDASNLSPEDTNGARDIYRHDRLTGVTMWISRNLTQFGASSFAPDMSADGNLIVFESYANFGNVADDNSHNDIYLVEVGHEPELISVNLEGIAGNSGSATPDISGNGSFVVFKSEATDLVEVDTDGNANIFIRRVR